MTQAGLELRLDHPLRTGEALSGDSLNRNQFAQSVVNVLRRVSSEAGLVVSVEGAWGSGKTSLLAMTEEILKTEQKDSTPIVVHFNPWLIGDRDALLRQFLASIAKEVKLTDHAKEGKRVAKELKTYSKAFDVLKLIPGAEPWASMVKAVVESVGTATEAVSDYKTPNIETRKQALEKALRKFPQRIVVLIDDIDRLFPAEAFEMVRIVKAVGDLPNVGYVLAWDPAYVSAALDKLNVPFATKYLDKVVQVRLPIPPLSFSMRVALINKGLSRLPKEALKTHFPNTEDRLGSLFHHGLSELMEQPRDVIRLFDVVGSIEFGLRGEIHLADVIGLACLMTKAPTVYELLHRIPQAFVGRRPGPRSAFKDAEHVIKEHSTERESAFNNSSSPKGVRDLVHYLFPLVAKADGAFTSEKVTFTEGHLAHPERLLVALQLSTQPSDVSLVRVQQFLLQPRMRTEISEGLEELSCVDFVCNIGDVAEGLGTDAALDTEDVCIAVARLVDSKVFVRRERYRQNVWELRPRKAAVEAIAQVAKDLQGQSAQLLAEKLIIDPVALSVAAELALKSFNNSVNEDNSGLRASKTNRENVLAAFATNIEQAAKSGTLFEKCDAEIILWAAARLVPKRCNAVFQTVAKYHSTLDKFVESFLRYSFDSSNGQSYGLPTEIKDLQVFVALEDLKKHAAERLQDKTMDYPVRAAWRSVLEGQRIYGKDGTVNED